ncbi:uncharacterized protein [Rhodnius prolixus]
MFLSNTINNPIPYIANEDDLTVVRERRANWKKGGTECKYFSICKEQDQPHNYWICHVGGNDQLLHNSPKIIEPPRISSVTEYVYEKHVDCTPKVPKRPCFVETRYECPSIPKPCKYSSKKIECIQTTPPLPSKECYKVTVEQPSMVPTELAPRYQVKSGKILRICACNKRNGLQDYCPMSRCMGRKECLTKPVPVCEPSGTQELVKKVYEVCCEFQE